MADQSYPSIESKADFKDTPQGLAQRWKVELEAAKKNQRKWIDQGTKVNKRYLGEKEGWDSKSQLNLFHSSAVTELAILYAKLPQVDVDRRFNDADDDAARVGGEMLERLLNTDIEREDDGFQAALRYALQDWKIPGLGQARVRYVAEFETVPEVPAQTGPCPMCKGSGKTQPISMVEPTTVCPDCQGQGQIETAPAVAEHEQKTFEDVETDYVHWRDFRWSPCRTWHETRWVGFRAEMTRDELKARFGDDLGKLVPMSSRRITEGEVKKDVQDAWLRADVWEIWCKEDRKVYWLNEGMDRILDVKDDPLGLEAFFPCPRPLVTNTTTTTFMPKPDFVIAQDLYNEIDDLTNRIVQLEKMAKVAGVHNAATPEIVRIWEEAFEGQTVPVANWATFSEKGGLKGSMELIPIGNIAQAIALLSDKRQEKIALLYQVTGFSDIVRGQATGTATATEQRLKAGFASTRLQTSQDELARFATDLQKMRSEIISKLFEPQTIISRSNILRTADAELAPRAVELIKSEFWQYRIQVRPDSMSLPDMATLKQEGVEFLGALSGFLQQMVPAAQQMPQSVPFLLEILKWTMAKFRGASTIEGVLDRAIAAAQQAVQAPKPPPPPDPRMEAVQVKAKAEMGKAQMDMRQSATQHQFDMQKMAAQAMLDRQKMQNEIAVQATKPSPMPPRMP